MKRFILSVCSLLSLLPVFGQNQPCYQNSRQSKVNILIFLAVDCPISQKYIPKLNSIQQIYSQGVSITAIVPGKIEKSEQEKFVEEYNLAFPLEVDKNYQCVKHLSAKVTPEVFVFDQQQVLRYRGAIDNWFYDLGEYRTNSTQDYLIDAIESLLAGKLPKIDKTSALGCYIQTR